MNINKIEFSAKVLEENLKEYAVKDNEASRLYEDLSIL
ncbi:hypothetical protein ALP59_200078 [Pseudomonas savastanoi]|uniref:Uncharacterized protein n=1 Tax=Pseudomonas savastanoi TaxID=29438 RepID=A0A3M5GJN9_PSESS|nr:hypothetical protein ALP59_200078 [Pseudomonas savastanoi]